jgi:Fe-S-cluster-containing hydrogenase component 2
MRTIQIACILFCPVLTILAAGSMPAHPFNHTRTLIQTPAHCSQSDDGRKACTEVTHVR